MNELEKLLKAGTPTPWFVGGVRFKMNGGDWHGIMSYNEAKKQDDNVCLVGYDPRTGEGHADARLIVAAVNALPELLAERDRLREALGWFLEDDRFRVAVGGNPRVVDDMLIRARAALQETKP